MPLTTGVLSVEKRINMSNYAVQEDGCFKIVHPKVVKLWEPLRHLAGGAQYTALTMLNFLESLRSNRKDLGQRAAELIVIQLKGDLSLQGIAKAKQLQTITNGRLINIVDATTYVTNLFVPELMPSWMASREIYRLSLALVGTIEKRSLLKKIEAELIKKVIYMPKYVTHSGKITFVDNDFYLLIKDWKAINNNGLNVILKACKSMLKENFSLKTNQINSITKPTLRLRRVINTLLSQRFKKISVLLGTISMACLLIGMECKYIEKLSVRHFYRSLNLSRHMTLQRIRKIIYCHKYIQLKDFSIHLTRII